MSGVRSRSARWARLATAGLAFGTAALIVAAYRPRFEATGAALASAELQLRSDEITLARLPEMTQRRTELATRYAAAFGGNPQAAFVRELGRTLDRHRVRLTSSVATEEPDVASGGYRSAFPASKLSLELRGRYRDLIAVIAGLSHGGELVRVEAPSFHRDASELAADVPLTLYEPARATPPPVASSTPAAAEGP